MYKVMQYRWIRDSSQNFSNEIWRGGRIRQARGKCKELLNSHTQMMLRHNITPFIVDKDNYQATALDEKFEAWYIIRYEIEEVSNANT